ncbi:MAG: glycoside hydrolase family 2 [Cyanobacteria bacterium DS2.3.42]|nr:glycoside hydrolase family 2 [Cyanobacteria bacterium DS2.3.42]
MKNSGHSATDAHEVPSGDAFGYQRPQLKRAFWQSLNGLWQFSIDRDNGWTRPAQVEFDKQINVPFAPETEASGINDQGLYRTVWYRRRFTAPRLVNGERLVINFGAVDYSAKVWINGHLAGAHEGGYTPFSIDATDFLKSGKAAEQEIVVRADDDPQDLSKPRGKQDWQLNAHSIWYPRTTGIWQSVWLEKLPKTHIVALKWTSSVERFEIGLTAVLSAQTRAGSRLNVKLAADGKTLVDDTYTVSEAEANQQELSRRISIPDGGIDDIRNHLLWSIHNPKLIDATLTLTSADGKSADAVTSYASIRSAEVQRDRFCINDRPETLRLVLNQGYWEKTGLTAPDDEALKKDIELIKSMGFNGVRMHQKIECPRFLYWADKLGLYVWEEMPSAYAFSDKTIERVSSQWVEAIKRDSSHPCIVAWVPINESWGVPSLSQVEAQRRFVASMYHLTKSLDPSRPVIGNDGWEMVETDIIAIHDYHHDPMVLEARYRNDESTTEHTLRLERPGHRLLLLEGLQRGERPIMLTEFGGIKLSTDESAWGYSVARTEDELKGLYLRLMSSINRLPLLAGFCYTQFTDTYQEANGLVKMDRSPKFDLEEMKRATHG